MTTTARILGTLDTTQVSRRHLLKGSLGAALGLGLAATGLPLPGAPTPTVSAALPFEAYHDQNAEQHHNRSFGLIERGYRITSLSVYGDAGSRRSLRYAAVWVKHPGQQISSTVYADTADEYQDTFDAQAKAGCAPVLISSAGRSDQPGRYAAVFARDVPGPWVARHNLGWDDFHRQMDKARTDGLIPRSLATHGYGSDTARFSGIWRRNAAGLPYNYTVHQHPNSYQRTFDNRTKDGYYPAVLATYGYLTAVWVRDDIGPWVARHNLTSEQYQEAFDDATRRGLVPLTVQAGGDADDIRFAAVFATPEAVRKANL